MTVSGTRECTRCGGALGSDGRCSVCGLTNSGRTDTDPRPSLESQKKSAEIYSMAQRRESAKSQRVAFLFNKSTSEKFPLSQSVSKIGRDQTNNISVTNDHYISRHHAWVLQMQGGYWVEDLGSTNGTLINGEILKERKQIFNGDRLTFGKTEFVFSLE